MSKYHCETCIDEDCDGSERLREALAALERLREELAQEKAGREDAERLISEYHRGMR